MPPSARTNGPASSTPNGGARGLCTSWRDPPPQGAQPLSAVRREVVSRLVALQGHPGLGPDLDRDRAGDRAASTGPSTASPTWRSAWSSRSSTATGWRSVKDAPRHRKLHILALSARREHLPPARRPPGYTYRRPRRDGRVPARETAARMGTSRRPAAGIGGRPAIARASMPTPRPGGRRRPNRRSPHMNIDTLPDEADFVFFAEALPEDGLHRVSIAVEGLGAPIPPRREGACPQRMQRPAAIRACWRRLLLSRAVFRFMSGSAPP